MGGALPGLLNGAAGVAWYAAENGRRKLADRALAHAKTHELLFDNASYGYGSAGYGMACLRCWHRFDDAVFLKDAVWIADTLVATATWADPQTCHWDRNPDGEPLVGMCHGPAGVALFLLYCHVVTGDAGYLRTGHAALNHDLACASEIQGAVGFPKAASSRNGIIYPYYSYGSAGIASVLARYFHVTKERWFADQYVRITKGVTQRYAINAGWESGLVGLGCCLLDGRRFLGIDAHANLAQIVDGLKLLAIKRDEGFAFTTAIPPEIRLDLASGSAGVALFLHWYREGGDNPFLLVDELLAKA
jgi:lantibiotic modifying enzyme